MEDGRTRGHITGDAEATRGLRCDDVAWLASGVASGKTSHLELGPVLIAAEQEIPPGSGYPMHPHHGLETITIVLDGSYVHETGSGEHAIVSVGDVAVVSTGCGGLHQETTRPGAPLRSIMVWARSNAPRSAPGFSHRSFCDRENRLVTVASGSGAAGALPVNANIEVLAGRFDRSAQCACDLGDARGYVIAGNGAIEINGVIAHPGERALITGDVEIRALEPTDLVLLAA